MRVRLEPGPSPVRVKARRYSPEQRAFMEKYADKLLEMDFCLVMPTASWQAAPLIVPKLGSRSRHRMAIDLRPINAATIKESWPMPHLDSEVMDFAGSNNFASLDFVSAYWQMPLDPDSYSACGIVTPEAVLASKRVLPGLANATSYFQSTVEPRFAEMRSNLKAWLDDFNLHTKSEAHLLSLLDRFFTICSKHGLFLSAIKSVFFPRHIKWCGRVISADGYKLDPARLSGLQQMAMPQTADELGQFIYCCRWMSNAIPDFARRVAPLNEVLEAAFNRSGKRTKRSIKKLALSTLSWGTAHTQAFHDLQDTLRNSVSLSYPKPGMEICIFTDESERFWSAVVTQTTPQDLERPLEEQRHEPLAFLGSQFKGAELGWSTFEKEGFAIFQTFNTLDYILMSSKPTHVYTDHRNLLFVFAPLALEPALGRHIVSKIQRWALFLSRFPYVIEHIEGTSNVFADILTRWTKGYRKERNALRTVYSLIESSSQIIPAADEFKWPKLNAMRRSQKKSKNDLKHRKDLFLGADDKLWKLKNGRIWIPNEDLELQLKVIVTSHCGSIGHRGIEATRSILKENFAWGTLDQDVEELVKGCLHCLITRSEFLVDRRTYCRWGDSKCKQRVVPNGLLQGSSLSCLLWDLYILDLPSKINEGNISLFADDTMVWTMCSTSGFRGCASKHQPTTTSGLVVIKYAGTCKGV